MMRITIPALSGMILVYMLVFARVGAMAMLMPGVADRSVPSRVRLMFALGLALAFAPQFAGYYHQTNPLTVPALFVLLFQEITVGVLLGALARIIVSTLSVAGFMLANQIGLAMAQTFDPTSPNDQGAILGNLISLLGLVLVFATNLHYLIITAITGSYHLIPPGAALPTADMAELAIRFVSGSFALGFQLAAPFVVFGFVVNLAFGVLSRMMPQLQIFFVVMPINVLIGFSLLSLFLGTMMTVYLEYFARQMGALQ